MNLLLPPAVPLHLLHGSELISLLGSAFHVLPSCCKYGPLAHRALLLPLKGSCSDLSCFCWCLTPASFWVWLVTPSLVLTAGREPNLLHKKKFFPGSRSWCHRRKIFLVVKAIKRCNVLPAVVVMIFVPGGIQM